MKPKCIVCNKDLTGKILYVGLNTETGSYTLNDKEATQGWFPIGKTCLTKLNLKKNLRSWKNEMARD